MSRTMIECHPPESLPAAWEAWRDHLARRKRPALKGGTAASALEGKSPLGWGVDLGDDRRAWLAELARAARGKKTSLDLAAEAESWASAAGQFPVGAELPWRLIESLAWAYALPALAARLPGETWWKLWRELVQTAAESHPTLDMAGAPLAYQLAAGELPLALACQFPELAVCEALYPAARDAQSLALEELLDGEGLPKATHLAWIRPLLASWTRVAMLGKAVRQAPWSEEAEAQYRWLVRQALRLTLPDGSQAGQPGAAQPDKTQRKALEQLLDAALDVGGDGADRRAADALLDRKPKKADRKAVKKVAGKKLIGKRKLIEPSLHSEWSEFSLLRSDWDASAAVLALRHDQPSMQIDFRLGGETIFQGDWNAEIRLNGQPLAFEGPWEPVCWQTDSDGTYLEFLADLAGGVRLGRQVYLARKDRFLLVADAVLGAQADGSASYRNGQHGEAGNGHASGPRLEYRGRLPWRGEEPEKAEKTRELTLLAGRERIRVAPLGLGEWRADRRFGRLETPVLDETSGARALELSQFTPGDSLYAPLFFDLDRKRARTFLTWRQLTVAEQRSIVHSDRAVGYRVLCDQQQWFVYRALDRPANRTVLGQNLVSEFLLARFKSDGETESLVEIEG